MKKIKLFIQKNKRAVLLVYLVMGIGFYIAGKYYQHHNGAKEVYPPKETWHSFKNSSASIGYSSYQN